MLGISPKNGVQRMSATVEAQSIVRAMATRYDGLKVAFPAIARTIGTSSRRARSFYDGTAEPSGTEIDRLRSANAALSEAKLTTEILIHATELEAHAARLASVDPDFYGPEIARLRDVANRARRVAY